MALSIAPTFVVVLTAIIVSLGIVTYRIRTLSSYLSLGKPEKRTDRVWERVKGLFQHVLLQRKTVNAKNPYGGVIHGFIFFGFIFLFPSIVEIIGAGLVEGFNLAFLGEPLYSLIRILQDVFSVIVTLGVLIALYRRFVSKPPRLEYGWEGIAILLLILGVTTTLLGYNAFNLSQASTPDPWMPLSQTLADWVAGSGLSASSRGAVAVGFSLAHAVVLLSFLALLPFTKHLHLMTSVPNVFFRSLTPRGALTHLDMEGEEESFGVSRIDGFTQKQLLDLYACTECGRCQDQCPAHLTQKPLSPKRVILDLRENLFENGPSLLKLKGVKDGANPEPEIKPLIGEAISEDVLWACTTCAACMEECPLLIEHINKIVDMRRFLVLTEGKLPTPELNKTFSNFETNGNPWGISSSQRGDWAKPLGVKVAGEGDGFEYLFFVGCAGSLDDRNKKVVTAMAKILQKAGISFAILGAEERCCGEPARRLGNEYLFQELAKGNIEKFKEAGVKKIITCCPHCFNTIKNEYPQLGGDFEVVHHSHLLMELLRSGRIKPGQGLPTALTYHDSCYLGRHNKIYEEPREVLGNLPGLALKEMKRSRERSFCCGAGGGRMWLEETIGKKINVDRIEQALATGTQTVGVACPYCMIMLEDGVKIKGVDEKLRVQDLAELVEKTL